MRGPKKILLMYITSNSGHNRASIGIENALKKISPSVEIMNINGFRYTNPILEKVINKTYMSLIRTKPEVWEYLYDNPKILKSVQGMREVIHKYNSKKLKSLLESFNPDVCVCTQAFPCGMVADYKKNLGLNLPLIGVLTDHAPHSYWIFNEVDYYIMPSETGKEHFMKNGVAESKIKVFGIPIDPVFGEIHDKNEICRDMGLDPEIPVILIMGGSQGLGPVENIVRVLDAKDTPFQLIIICGTNKKLEKILSKRIKKSRKKTVVLGHVKNVDKLMEISHIVITKPGGLTTSEALAKDLPMIIVNPIPGQEQKNTEYLLKQEVALKAEDNEDIAALVEELFLNKTKLKEMSIRAANLKKPNAAMNTAKLVLDII
jgi:processive 1,2-diacylglycerol beta-glucosyltransferase